MTTHDPGPGDTAVLVVDDDQAIAAIIGIVVEEAGYLPLFARDGAEALVLARERPPALIITDLMMPVLDGAGLVAALRLEGTVPPVVVVTAAPARAAALGVDAVLSKPFRIEALEEILARFLPR
jgi:CheY-like chemotaxis protein